MRNFPAKHNNQNTQDFRSLSPKAITPFFKEQTKLILATPVKKHELKIKSPSKKSGTHNLQVMN